MLGVPVIAPVLSYTTTCISSLVVKPKSRAFCEVPGIPSNCDACCHASKSEELILCVTMSTLNALPKTPGHLATHSPWSDTFNDAARYSDSFFNKSSVAPTDALRASDATTLTTFKAFPYFKNDAA